MLENFIYFTVGMLIAWFLNYIMGLGHAINVLKQTQRSCSALFVVSEQGLQEILYLKYMAMDETGRSQQNITAQKYIDQMNILSIKKTIMRNYVNAYPTSYSNTMEYSTWEEMEEYVNKTIQKGEEIS